MKRWLPAVGILCALGTAIVAWRHRAPTPTSHPETARAVRGRTPPPPPMASAPAPNQVAADPLPTAVDLHALIGRLLSADTGAPPDDLLRALEPLLTDDNVGNVVASLSPAEYNSAFGTLAVQRWLRVNPSAAVAWLAQHDDAGRIALVVSQFAAAPALVEATLATVPEGRWKQQTLHATALALAETAPAEAVALGQRVTDPARRIDVLETVAYSWCTHDPTAACAWLVDWPDAGERERLCTIATKAIATTDPDLAAAWLSALPPTLRTAETVASLAELWAERSPGAAAGWAQGIAAPDLRRRASEQVLASWMRSDRASATQWAAGLPDGAALLSDWTRRQAADADPHDPSP